MKKISLVVLLVVPFFLSPALANPSLGGERLIKPILYLGKELPPGINMISPEHVPVPSNSSGVGPGSQLLISRPDGTFVCTANFLWTGTTITGGKGTAVSGSQTSEPKTYLGAAGHCFVPVGLTSTHGVGANYDASLSKVSVCVSNCEFGGELGPFFGDFVDLGPVAYARQTRNVIGEGNDPVGNDFGIVEIPQTEEFMNLIRPEIPVWGGPSGVEDVSLGRGVCLYGNGVATGETFVTKARAGIGEGLYPDKRAWKAFLPSTPGDSGSAIVTCDRDADGVHGLGAAGILTHIVILPDTARIVGTTVGQGVQMTKTDAGIALSLLLEGGASVAPSALSAPDAPAISESQDAAIKVGDEFSWSSGPFTRVSTTGVLLGEACIGPGDQCDYRFVRVRVPKGGADLRVTVSTDDDTADFDLFVYGPDGAFLASSASPFTPPEEVVYRVTQSGVYTLGVNPFTTVNANYSGAVRLELPAPPPEPEFDGELSVGGEPYSWEGDPPLDASVFTCAEVAFGFVSAFCDNEILKINVPSEGATLIVDINAASAGDDFDLYIYPPDGSQIRFEEVGDEHAVLQVTRSGIYRLGIVARFAPLGTYTGVARL